MTFPRDRQKSIRDRLGKSFVRAEPAIEVPIRAPRRATLDVARPGLEAATDVPSSPRACIAEAAGGAQGGLVGELAGGLAAVRRLAGGLAAASATPRRRMPTVQMPCQMQLHFTHVCREKVQLNSRSGRTPLSDI